MHQFGFPIPPYFDYVGNCFSLFIQVLARKKIDQVGEEEVSSCFEFNFLMSSN
jgi:hypothetical protein